MTAPGIAHAGDAEHEPEPMTIRLRRPGECQTHAMLIRPRTAFALQIRVVPVDFEVARAAHPHAQVAVVSRQTARRGHGRRRARSRRTIRRGRASRSSRRRRSGTSVRCVARTAADAQREH